MDISLIIILVIIIIISLLISSYIILYNKINFYNIRINEAQKIILEEIENRYNLFKETRKTIEKNTKMDLNIFDHIDKEKDSSISSYDFEKELTKAIDTIYVLKEDYPKLETKKNFKDILNKLDESDTKLEAAKSYYNQCNQKLKLETKKIPCKLIAFINKIHVKPSYEAKEIFNENIDGIKI